MERLLNMILRRLMNKGINSGIKAVSNRGKRGGDDTQEARAANRQAQKNIKNVRQSARIFRRFNKF